MRFYFTANTGQSKVQTIFDHTIAGHSNELRPPIISRQCNSVRIVDQSLGINSFQSEQLIEFSLSGIINRRGLSHVNILVH